MLGHIVTIVSLLSTTFGLFILKMEKTVLYIGSGDQILQNHKEDCFSEGRFLKRFRNLK